MRICFYFFWVADFLEKLMEGIYQTRHAKNYQRVKRMLNFIEAHYNELLTVERISKEVYLSPSRLREKELPISQIALEVGYSDQSYFTKVFKKVEKCTPETFGEKAFQPQV